MMPENEAQMWTGQLVRLQSQPLVPSLLLPGLALEGKNCHNRAHEILAPGTVLWKRRKHVCPPWQLVASEKVGIHAS